MPDSVGLWPTAVNLGPVMVIAVPLVFSLAAEAWTGSERWDIKDAGDCSELDARTT